MKIVGQRLRALRESMKLSQTKAGEIFDALQKMEETGELPDSYLHIGVRE